MAELTPQQARGVLEQLRDRNLAINQIDEVLRIHALAVAQTESVDQAMARKEADLRSAEQNYTAKIAQIEEAQVALNEANARFAGVRKEAMDAINAETEQARIQHEKTLEGYAAQIGEAEHKLARVNTALVQQQKALEQIYNRIDALKAVPVE